MKRIRCVDGAIAGLHEYRESDGIRASWNRYRRCSRDENGRRRYYELIDKLISSQHGICGYCEMRIGKGNQQVEHVVPKSVDPELQFEGTNLIACCLGGTNPKIQNPGSKDNLSCGQKKGNGVLPDIADPRVLPCFPSLLIVSSDGKISPNSGSVAELGLEVHEVSRAIELLGLNARRLQVLRRNLWKELRQEVMSKVDNLGTEAQKLEKSKDLALGMLMPGPDDGELPQFFTTIRSFFGGVAEAVLHEKLPEWI